MTLKSAAWATRPGSTGQTKSRLFQTMKPTSRPTMKTVVCDPLQIMDMAVLGQDRIMGMGAPKQKINGGPLATTKSFRIFPEV